MPPLALCNIMSLTISCLTRNDQNQYRYFDDKQQINIKSQKSCYMLVSKKPRIELNFSVLINQTLIEKPECAKYLCVCILIIYRRGKPFRQILQKNLHILWNDLQIAIFFVAIYSKSSLIFLVSLASSIFLVK